MDKLLRPTRTTAHEPIVRIGSRGTHEPRLVLASKRDNTSERMCRVPDTPTPTTDRHAKRHERHGDMFKRFGIKSGTAQLAAYAVVLLLSFQPVYVALGMELPEGQGTDGEQVAADTSAREETTASEEDTTEETVSVDERSGEHDEPSDTVSDEAVSSDASEEEIQGDETEQQTIESDAEGSVSGEDETTDDDGVSDDETSDEEANSVDDGSNATASSTEDMDDSNTESDNTTSEQDYDETTDQATSTDDTATSTDTTSSNDGEDGEQTGTGGGGSDASDDTSDGSNGEESENNATTTDETANNATSTDKANNNVATSTASSSDETQISDEATAELHVAQNADSKYVFAEGDCTLVQNGEFYCIQKSGTIAPQPGNASVYTKEDTDGDREVFFFDGVEERRITNNAYDDQAPIYEAEEQRIVWHGMVNDRLQVFLHDLVTNETTQLTHGTTNSSNPHIHGDTVVWQSWADNNWEIYMIDDVDDTTPDVERLTENSVHDMFPQAYDGLVTWQREHDGSWEVVVYDIRTETNTTLEKGDDSRYENPRFALLFDARNDNGDTETVGFDIETGERIQLGTTGHRPPVDAPATPDDKTSDAIPTESASTTLKTERRSEGDDGGTA